MYFIKKIAFYVRDKARINQYAIDVKKGNLLKFDEIDKVIRPHIRKMTYRHSYDPHIREDMEQAMLEFSLNLCKRYDIKNGDFENYCLRSVYFELMKYWKKYYEESQHEILHETLLDTIHDKTADYASYGNLIVEDFVRSFYKAIPLSSFEKEVFQKIEEGLSLREIATEFKRSEKSIKNTLYRIDQKKLKSWVY